MHGLNKAARAGNDQWTVVVAELHHTSGDYGNEHLHDKLQR